jgi:hypothetical protein
MKMIELLSSDFRPLEGFGRRWRWTDPKCDVLPLSDLAQIRPLKEEKAYALWEYAYVYMLELSRYAFTDISEPLTSALFEWIQHVDISQEPVKKVQEHLRAFESQEDQVVLVMWEPEEAVTTPWRVFCTYWDDFCFPSSDDVGIWPLSERWGLEYHHEEQLIFGRPRLPLLDQVARERAWNPPAKPLVHRDDVLRLLRANEKIAAIMLYEHDTGVRRKVAMDAVNKLLAEIGDGDD